MKFKINQWVIRDSNEHKGSIVAIDGDYYEVHWFLFKSGKPLPKNLAVRSMHLEYQLVEWPDEPPIYSEDKIDLALQTEDEEWFGEIMSLKGENVE